MTHGGRSHRDALTRVLAFATALLGTWLFPTQARALVLQAPAGGDAFVVPYESVVCNPLPETWTADITRRRLRPPQDASRQGKAGTVILAPSWAACGTSAGEKATVLVTGAVPSIDPASVTLFVDGGRLELRGEDLEGVRIAWKAGNVAGSDVC
ncbi:MAG TPA: hypothetical protein VF395_08040, partial [Polyangiaceae bacterium]